jgi:hypothetical protein
MRVKVENAGEFGVICDRPPSDIPMNAWTSAYNVRFRRNFAEPILGYETMFATAGESYYLCGLLTGGTQMLAYPVDYNEDGKAETLYCYDGATETEITRDSGGDYTATSRWNGCSFNGVIIYTNMSDCPQYWGGDDGVAAANLIYTGSYNWDSTDGAGTTYRAAVIRPFRNFLVAMNIIDDGAAYPYLVHWSNPADPGTIPDSWDYTNPENLSGRVDLADSPGVVIDGLALREVFAIYKEDAVWLMSYIGGQYQFRFDKMSGVLGLIGQDCVVDIGGRHVCWGPKRIYMHDGSNIVDILDDKYFETFYSHVDPEQLDQCFLVHSQPFYEVWFCYVPLGQTIPCEAHVYNYKTGVWSRRQIPPCHYISMQQYIADAENSPGPSWPASTNTTVGWDDDTTLGWDYVSYYDPAAIALLSSGAVIHAVDVGSTFDGEDFECQLERTELRLTDGGAQVFLRELYPRFRGTGTVDITVGTQSPVADGPDWGTEQTFTIGTTTKLNMTLSGEFAAIRFESLGSSRWQLPGYEFDVEFVGSY